MTEPKNNTDNPGNFKNAIMKLIEDKRKISKAIRNGSDITKINGVQIVQPL